MEEANEREDIGGEPIDFRERILNMINQGKRED